MLKSRLRITSCFLWVALTYLGFYSPNPVKAQAQYGLNAIGYVIDQIPPTQSDDVYPTCGSELENNINRNFDGEPFAQCPNDLFMVHYSGYLTIPQHETIEFWIAADDGGTLNINGNQFGDWNDKGCSWYPSGLLDLPSEQSVSLDGWFYENGGGTCYMLAWNIDGLGWEIVPDSAFTVNQVTTTTSTTTTSTTTTTVPETTTTVPETTTTQPKRTTTTTEPESVVVPVPTATTVTPMSTTTYLPASTSTTTSLAPTTSQVTISTSSTSTVPPIVTTVPQIPENITEISNEEAVTLATSPEVLKQVTEEQAVEIFKAVEVSTLSDEQADELVAAVQNAPQEVRAAFENEINIFGGKFNKYVPIGSTINVGQRKVLVAASGVLFVAPTVSVSSSSSSSEPNSNKKRK